MSTTYSCGGFSVKIEDDGSIIVKPGDTIGGYCKAIHGNFDHLYEYSRPNGQTTVPVENINLIYAGETLFHEPSRPSALDPVNRVDPVTPSGVLPTRSDGTYDIDRIIREQSIAPEFKTALTYLLNGSRLAQAGGSLAMLFTTETSKLTTVLASSGMTGAVGFGLPAAGALLGIFAGCFSLWNAANVNVDLIHKRAILYGGVAWVFNHTVPTLPDAMRAGLSDTELNGSGRLGGYFGSEGAMSIWNRGAQEGHLHMRKFCVENGLNEDGVRPILQATFGDPTRIYAVEKQLAAAWMVDFAHVFYPDGYIQTDESRRGYFLQPYSWYPHDSRVGRPAYLPAIDSRYPYG